MSGDIEINMVRRLSLNGWVILASLSAVSAILLPLKVTFGVVAGGLIVAVNLQMLQRLVLKTLALGKKATPKSVLLRFYIAFAVTALVIFFLIALRVVNELGLLLGLAGFIINVTFFAFQEMGKLILKQFSKEAV